MGIKRSGGFIMKKEEIIIQAFRLCEELKTLGFDSSIYLANHVDNITINVWRKGDIEMEDVIRVDAYFHDEYLISTQSIKSVIPTLQNFINQQKQIA